MSRLVASFLFGRGALIGSVCILHFFEAGMSAARAGVQQGVALMQAYPKVKESLELLKNVGWAMGDVCVEHPNGRVWIVTGQRGKHWIIARAPSQPAAWWLAWRQAAALARSRRGTKKTDV